jgi:hypothetical protein
MGNAGLAFVRANQGATTKALAIIEQAMVHKTHPTTTHFSSKMDA